MRITEKDCKYYCEVVGRYLKRNVKLITHNGTHHASIMSRQGGGENYVLTCYGTTREVYYCLVSIVNALGYAYGIYGREE